MRGFLLGLSVTVMLATGAIAEPFCEGFAALQANNSTHDQSFALQDHKAAQAGCRTSLSVGGGRSLHCMWRFEYRAEIAADAFEKLLVQIGHCGGIAQGQDQSVNHPDFYDLRLFDLLGSEIGVSLKDKGALQQTLVFLTLSKP